MRQTSLSDGVGMQLPGELAAACQLLEHAKAQSDQCSLKDGLQWMISQEFLCLPIFQGPDLIRDLLGVSLQG